MGLVEPYLSIKLSMDRALAEVKELREVYVNKIKEVDAMSKHYLDMFEVLEKMIPKLRDKDKVEFLEEFIPKLPFDIIQKLPSNLIPKLPFEPPRKAGGSQDEDN